MKEFDSDVGHDLDAGWDDIEGDRTSVSVKVTSHTQISSVEDLDEGWDLDDPGPTAVASVRSSPNTRPAKVQPKKAPPLNVREAPPSLSVVHVLSKRERREQERQNRIRAAKQKLDAKTQRKLQRRADEKRASQQAALAAAIADKGLAAHSCGKMKSKANGNSNVRKNAPAVKNRPLPKPRTVTPEARIQGDNARIAENSSSSSNVNTNSRASRTWLWWALGIALLLIATIVISRLR